MDTATLKELRDIVANAPSPLSGPSQEGMWKIWLNAEELIASAERVARLEAFAQSIVNIDMKQMREDFGDNADNQFRQWAQSRARQALGG